MTRTPFPGLNYYRFEDADLFFGREEETRKMVGEILSTRLLVLFSPSGSGKTSLIQAGVRPQLEQLGYKTIYTRLESEPILSICQAVSTELNILNSDQTLDLHDFLKQGVMKAGKPLVIFLDQFEEFFLVYREHPKLRAEFVKQVATIRRDDTLHVFLILSLREDYFASLHEFSEVIPSIFQNNANIRLEPFTEDNALRALVEPLKTVGHTMDDRLIPLLITDLKRAHIQGEKKLKPGSKLNSIPNKKVKNNHGLTDHLEEDIPSLCDEPEPGTSADSEPCIDPIQLQIVCTELWNRRDEKESRISKEIYENCGGAKTIINGFVQERLDKIPRHKLKQLEKIFNALKTPDNTKRYCSFEELITNLNIKRKKPFKDLLGKLEALDILRCSDRGRTTWYEYRHDYLVPKVVRWMEEKKEKRNHRRMYYAGLPGIILLLVLFIYFFSQYNTFYAEFADKEYPNQREEIIITRGFNPFRERSITTGYFKNDLKDQHTENIVKNKYKISYWNKNNWNALTNILKKSQGGKFLFEMGQRDKSFKILKDIWKSKENPENYLNILLKIGQFDNYAINLAKEALKNNKSIIRYYAIKLLIDYSKSDKTINNLLVSSLKDSNKRIRVLVASHLWKTYNSPEEVIQVLLDALSDTNIYIRISAAETLIEMGKPFNEVITILFDALKDSDNEVKMAAAKVLGKFGNTNKKVIDLLLDVIKGKEKYYRSIAIKTLGYTRKIDKNVINILLKILRNSDNNMVIASVEALGNIGNSEKDVIDLLYLTLKNPDGAIRILSAEALIKLGYFDQRIIQVLRETLIKQGSENRCLAIKLLGESKIFDLQLINDLFDKLKDSNKYVRQCASEALGNILNPNEIVLNSLMLSLKDSFWGVGQSAGIAIGKLLQSKMDSELINMLQNKDWGHRMAAAYALSTKYKNKKLAPETLKQIETFRTQDDRPWVRMAAWETSFLFYEKEYERDLF